MSNENNDDEKLLSIFALMEKAGLPRTPLIEIMAKRYLLAAIAELEESGFPRTPQLEINAKRMAMVDIRRDEMRRQSVPLMQALSEVGIYVDTPSRLLSMDYDYELVIPLLLKHFEMPYPQGTREGILRAICVREASHLVSPKLVELFPLEKDKSVKSLIANALTVVCRPEEIEHILGFINDPQHGETRKGFLAILARILKAQSIPILLSLLKKESPLETDIDIEQDFYTKIIETLGKVKAKEALPLIEKLTQHEKRYIRTQARRALKRLK